MEILYRISFAFIYFIQFFGIIYYNKKSNVENVVIDHKEPKYIIFIRVPWAFIIVIVIILLIIYPTFFDFSNLYLKDSIRTLGIILGVVIDIALFWTLISLGKNISTTLSIGENHILVISGPYKFIRHPMYSLGIVLFLSLMLISSNWIIGLLGILFQISVMIFRTPYEEKMLVDHFGAEYINYRLRTGKFFPKII